MWVPLWVRLCVHGSDWVGCTGRGEVRGAAVTRELPERAAAGRIECLCRLGSLWGWSRALSGLYIVLQLLQLYVCVL